MRLSWVVGVALTGIVVAAACSGGSANPEAPANDEAAGPVSEAEAAAEETAAAGF